MKIILTRHGQSMTNIAADLTAIHPINTRNNILTETGIQQAMDFAHKLKEGEVVVSEIVCSPYARTKQTAFTIASVLATCVPIHYNKKFQEIEWDVGGKFDRLENYIPDFDSKSMEVDYKPLIDHKRGAITLESQEDVYNRVIPEFVRVAKRAKRTKKNILVVGHFFVARAVMAYMTEGNVQGMMNHSPKNLCMLDYDVEDVISRFTA